MTDQADHDNSGTSFELKDALTAFDQFSSAEIERLQQTEPDFDPELYERAKRLVMSRLDALQSTDDR